MIHIDEDLTVLRVIVKTFETYSALKVLLFFIKQTSRISILISTMVTINMKLHAAVHSGSTNQNSSMAPSMQCDMNKLYSCLSIFFYSYYLLLFCYFVVTFSSVFCDVHR